MCSTLRPANAGVGEEVQFKKDRVLEIEKGAAFSKRKNTRRRKEKGKKDARFSRMASRAAGTVRAPRTSQEDRLSTPELLESSGKAPGEKGTV